MVRNIDKLEDQIAFCVNWSHRAEASYPLLYGAVTRSTSVNRRIDFESVSLMGPVLRLLHSNQETRPQFADFTQRMYSRIGVIAKKAQKRILPQNEFSFPVSDYLLTEIQIIYSVLRDRMQQDLRSVNRQTLLSDVKMADGEYDDFVNQLPVGSQAELFRDLDELVEFIELTDSWTRIFFLKLWRALIDFPVQARDFCEQHHDAIVDRDVMTTNAFYVKSRLIDCIST